MSNAECMCETDAFRTAEDYRDHLPCPKVALAKTESRLSEAASLACRSLAALQQTVWTTADRNLLIRDLQGFIRNAMIVGVDFRKPIVGIDFGKPGGDDTVVTTLEPEGEGWKIIDQRVHRLHDQIANFDIAAASEQVARSDSSVLKKPDIFERIAKTKAKHWRPETPAEAIVWCLFTQAPPAYTWEQALRYEFGDKFTDEAKAWFNEVAEGESGRAFRERDDLQGILNEQIEVNKELVTTQRSLRATVEEQKKQKEALGQRLIEANGLLKTAQLVMQQMPILTRAMQAICARLVKLIDLLDKNEKPTKEELAKLRQMAKAMSS